MILKILTKHNPPILQKVSVALGCIRTFRDPLEDLAKWIEKPENVSGGREMESFWAVTYFNGKCRNQVSRGTSF